VEVRGKSPFPQGSARPFPDPDTYAARPDAPPGVTWPSLFHPRELQLAAVADASAAGAAGAGAGAGAGAADGAGAGAAEDDDPSSSTWLGREAAAVAVGAVWEDVDEARNSKCMPSLAIHRIRSLPPYHTCFQGF